MAQRQQGMRVAYCNSSGESIYLVFLICLLHSLSCIDSGELPGVVAMKLPLAAPGCLPGRAIGGLAEMRLGLLLAATNAHWARPLTVGRLQGRDIENRIDSIDRVDRLNTMRLRVIGRR